MVDALGVVMQKIVAQIANPALHYQLVVGIHAAPARLSLPPQPRLPVRIPVAVPDPASTELRAARETKSSTIARIVHGPFDLGAQCGWNFLIGRALESVVGWAGEIIVVINHDVNDGTEKIAASFGVKAEQPRLGRFFCGRVFLGNMALP